MHEVKEEILLWIDSNEPGFVILSIDGVPMVEMHRNLGLSHFAFNSPIVAQVFPNIPNSETGKLKIFQSMVKKLLDRFDRKDIEGLKIDFQRPCKVHH